MVVSFSLSAAAAIAIAAIAIAVAIGIGIVGNLSACLGNPHFHYFLFRSDSMLFFLSSSLPKQIKNQFLTLFSFPSLNPNPKTNQDVFSFYSVNYATLYLNGNKSNLLLLLT